MKTPRLGLRANWRQFSLLVLVNGFVGAMIGMERAILPSIAEHDFQLAAKAAVLSFIVVFGVTKAGTPERDGVPDPARRDRRHRPSGVARDIGRRVPLWRDLGYAIGALVAGATTNLLGVPAAIRLVAALTLASGPVVALRMSEAIASRCAGTPDPADAVTGSAARKQLTRRERHA